MKVYMLWHGGSSYAVGGLGDIEEFETLTDAMEVMREREAGRDPYRPCVSGSSAWCFKSDPREECHGGDFYPDFVLEFGPRGGLRKVLV